MNWLMAITSDASFISAQPSTSFRHARLDRHVIANAHVTVRRTPGHIYILHWNQEFHLQIDSLLGANNNEKKKNKP